MYCNGPMFSEKQCRRGFQLVMKLFWIGAPDKTDEKRTRASIFVTVPDHISTRILKASAVRPRKTVCVSGSIIFSFSPCKRFDKIEIIYALPPIENFAM